LARFQGYCERQGYAAVVTFTDVMSGRRDDRRGYQRMLQYVSEGNADVIVVQWLDRFGRNPKEILTRYWVLEEMGVGVEATDEDLKEELILLIKAGLAGAESRKNSERVRANMSRAVSKGVHIGRAPYGLRRVKRLDEGKVVTEWELEPHEAATVREMYRLAVRENKGFKAIAQILHDMGHKNRSGRPFGSWAVRQILTNEAIKGTLVYGRRARGGGEPLPLVRLPDFFPAILTEEEWERLQERLAIRRETPKGKGHISTYLLSGIARCGHCGGTMVGHTGSLQRNGTRYRNYRCRRAEHSRALCPYKNYHSALKLEPAILEYLGQFSNPERVREILAQEERTRPDALKGELAGVEKRLAALDQELLAHLDLVKRGILNEAEFTKANEARRGEREALEKRKVDFQERIAKVRSQAEQVEKVPVAVRSFLEDFSKLDVRQAKAILQTILKAAYVYRDGRIELEFRL
jgi:site-specific DNA recombinase